MKNIHLKKTQYGFEAATEEDLEAISLYPEGCFCVGDIVKPRNAEFHRLGMGLLRFGYKYFDPPGSVMVDGVEVPVTKSFEAYRKLVTIKAGYYDAVSTFDGRGIVLEAHSISYSGMEDGEFREYYKNVKDLLWSEIFSSYDGWTEDQYNEAVQNYMDGKYGNINAKK